MKKDSFEYNLARLEELAAAIRDENTSLDDAIMFYEEGMECYSKCSNILENTKAKIEVFKF